MDIRTTKQSFDFVDPIDIDGRVVYVDLWSLESPCGSSGPLTFVHFKSPDVRTALFFCCVFSDCLTAVLPPLYRTDYPQGPSSKFWRMKKNVVNLQWMGICQTSDCTCECPEDTHTHDEACNCECERCVEWLEEETPEEVKAVTPAIKKRRSTDPAVQLIAR